jgi:hypothetical protein
MSSDGMVKRHSRRGAVYTAKKIVIKEGWSGLYKGLSVNLIRTVPNSAVTMLTYVPSTLVAQVRTFMIRADTTIRYELLMRYLSTI